ncbi:ABC transporter substrate-binding protein [Desulfosporosinus sp. BICA1-9]|uniref:ABC transporter substrate-binding protein n=1 Tax=Desulfosporosinus sp. BICA1-9 TaxID=1531958 RepID=UPI00054C11EB|nr:ABC transporter substrate-binding protein [Desulfosporosinus sp. BICA1-9]KJS46597.1 MAG: branched-chain amino acid ABC transporter substrate-binding protein [Peptococcaceae bacterium BRH_c23]KJS87355.1 MAG: branched-chain amino acid ABC transporter substrate-binding protein [Desulfosporosinus sp. BICA1-9]
MLKKTTMCEIIIICTVSFLLLTGCTKLEEPNEIVIGVAWPFETNKNLFNEGIDLAVKEINSSGGIKGRELRLLKEDDGSELVKGMAIAESFAENNEIQAVIGHDNSFISIPASAIYNNAGLVMLSPASTAPELTKNDYKYIFRNIPSDDEIARQLTLYLAEQGYRRMVIYYSDDSYGNGLANSFEDHANSLGITIVDRFDYYTNLEDLRRLHNRWQAYGVDGIFIAKTLPEGGQFISDAGQTGINLPFIAGDALDSPILSEIGGKAAEGTIIGSVFNPYIDRPEVKRFGTDFLAEHQKEPSSDAALGYDAVNMLANAIEKSDLLNRSSVAKELKNLGKWSGVTGIHEFDEKGDDIGDLVVLKKLLNGEFEYIEK